MTKLLTQAETLNTFFTEAALNLKIPKYKTSSFEIYENKSSKNIKRIVERHKNHPSVTAFKLAFPYLSFSFKPVVREDILKQIKNLKSTKATQEHDILRRNREISILSETSWYNTR